MAWNDATQPAGWVAISTVRLDGLFFQTDALTFALSASTAVAYDVRNYYGDIVRSGTLSGTSLTLAPGLPLGWYKLYLYQAGSDANYGTMIGTAQFSVIASDARFVGPPAFGTRVGSALDASAPDHAARGISLIGPHRNSVNDATSISSSISMIQDDRAYQRTWYEANPDSVRPRPAFVSFPNGGYQDGAHTGGVSAAVAALYPDVTYFEGPANEPSGNAPAVVAGWMQTFFDAVKAGNASAKVLGPSPVTINGAAVGLSWFDAFLAAGGASYVDALSFHHYNGVNGDLALGRRTLDAFMAVLAKYGKQHVELWQTECGTHAQCYGVFTPRRQARWWAMQRFLFEQYGIPKERDYWFYDSSHGFWGFPSWWHMASGLTPMVAMSRVYSAEVYGKTWAERLDFGTVENSHYIGSRFIGSDSTATIALLAGGRTDGTIGLRVTGAPSVVVVDCFGNASTVPVSAGIAAIPVTVEPTYVRIAANCQATVEAVEYGANIARDNYATGSGSVPPARIVNGSLENWYYLDGGPTEFRDDATLPAIITVQLSAYGATNPPGRRVDTVVIDCPSPWQEQGTLLDFDVAYRDGAGAWHTIATVSEPSMTFSAPDNERNFYDTFHSGRSVFVQTFSPVMATALRLTVRDCTAGGEATLAAVNVGGGSGQGGAHAVRIREIAAYCRDSAQHTQVVLLAT